MAATLRSRRVEEDKKGKNKMKLFYQKVEDNIGLIGKIMGGQQEIEDKIVKDMVVMEKVDVEEE